jgi:hypothetical protein
MLALYRSGRQADALDAYRKARRILVEQLGLEPGPELHDLNQAMLVHDPGLQPPAGRDGHASTRSSALPSPPNRTIGRGCGTTAGRCPGHGQCARDHPAPGRVGRAGG